MPNPVQLNPLGQIADAVVEQLKSVPTQTIKTAVTEPAKILEQILGDSNNGNDQGATGEQQLEQGQVNQNQTVNPQAAQLKHQQQLEQDAAHYQLHQQRLQEQIAHFEKQKQQQKQQQTVKDQQEEQNKQVVQLKREQEQDEEWQKQIRAVQGSHEGQLGKM